MNVTRTTGHLGTLLLAIGACAVLLQTPIGDPGRTTAPAMAAGSEETPSQRFIATAYCKGTTTASGVKVRSGIAAADPALLPVGSVIDVTALGEPYDGIYTVMDTGPAVRGRKIDLYIWSCYEALDFGARRAQVKVLRHGWDPNPNREAARTGPGGSVAEGTADYTLSSLRSPLRSP